MSLLSSETEVGACYRKGFYIFGLIFGREDNLLFSFCIFFGHCSDIIKIDSYCRRRYIELVPHIESLSGFSQW